MVKSCPDVLWRFVGWSIDLARCSFGQAGPVGILIAYPPKLFPMEMKRKLAIGL